MATKREKKEAIRRGIIDAANIYSEELAGKAFLYVINDTYFEISFRKDRFLHLTGVATYLSAKNFYTKAKDGILADRQFYFDLDHPYHSARDKIPCLKRLPELTNHFVCILHDMPTPTLVYKIGVTNLEFTLGLTEHTDKYGNKIDGFYLPRTLRVNDHPLDKSSDPNDGIVDFIFKKDASMHKYTEIAVADKRKIIPNCIRHLVDGSFFA